jgi:PHD/YefM family antitoxin component YafN of YafNO toxin-antitoxin module
MKYILSENGEKEAVLLSINEWKQMVKEKNEMNHFFESINKINASKTFTNNERILLLGLFLKSF